MSTTNNTASTDTARPGVGGKIKGAYHVVHGIGENIRGTALGAVDTLGKTGETRNDEIARQGRMELEQGKANVKGLRTSNTQPHNNNSGTSRPRDQAADPATHPGAGAGPTAIPRHQEGTEAAGPGDADVLHRQEEDAQNVPAPGAQSHSIHTQQNQNAGVAGAPPPPRHVSKAPHEATGAETRAGQNGSSYPAGAQLGVGGAGVGGVTDAYQHGDDARSNTNASGLGATHGSQASYGATGAETRGGENGGSYPAGAQQVLSEGATGSSGAYHRSDDTQPSPNASSSSEADPQRQRSQIPHGGAESRGSQNGSLHPAGTELGVGGGGPGGGGTGTHQYGDDNQRDHSASGAGAAPQGQGSQIPYGAETHGGQDGSSYSVGAGGGVGSGPDTDDTQQRPNVSEVGATAHGHGSQIRHEATGAGTRAGEDGNWNQGGTQQGVGEGTGGGPGAYHHRDDAVTNLQSGPEEQHRASHGAGQYSTANKNEIPAYDRNAGYDKNKGEGVGGLRPERDVNGDAHLHDNEENVKTRNGFTNDATDANSGGHGTHGQAGVQRRDEGEELQGSV